MGEGHLGIQAGVQLIEVVHLIWGLLITIGFTVVLNTAQPSWLLI